MTLDLTREQFETIRKSIRALDVGAHYCRWCTASSSNGWQHHGGCAYAESVKDRDEAKAILDKAYADWRAG